MADIVDSLITRIQLIGAGQFIYSFFNLEKASRAVGVASDAAVEAIRRYGPASTEAAAALDILNDAGLKVVTMAERVNAAFEVFFPIFVISSIFELAKSMQSIGSEANELQGRLANLYNSQEKGAQAFAALQAEASHSPESMKQLTDSLIILQNAGLHPTIHNLESINAASKTTGKSVESISQIIAKMEFGKGKGMETLGFSKETLSKLEHGVVDAKGHIKNYGEATKLVLDEIDKHFGESAQHFGDTIPGAMQELTNKWQIFMNTIAGNPNGEIELLKDLGAVLDVATAAIQSIKTVMDLAQLGLLEIARLLLFLTNPLDIGHPRAQVNDWIKESLKYSEDAMQKFMDMATGKKQDLPTGGRPLDNPNGPSNSAADLVRQVINGGFIANIGLKASEMPGLQHNLKKGPITVRLETNASSSLRKALEDAVNQVLEKLSAHGEIMPAGSPGY